MTGGDVDAFFASDTKTLPARPEWRDGNRDGERRAALPIAVGGVVSLFQLAMTVRLQEPEYLMLAIGGGRQVCRLCATTSHRDRRTGELIDSSHFHSWEANRPAHGGIPKRLYSCEAIPLAIVGRDAAFHWLARVRESAPDWMPIIWPLRQSLF